MKQEKITKLKQKKKKISAYEAINGLSDPDLPLTLPQTPPEFIIGNKI